MHYQNEREEFIAKAVVEGLDLDTCHKLLRHATRLHRLAEARCNGDWPYNGDRDGYRHPKYGDANGHWWLEEYYATCPRCEARVVKSAMRKSPDTAVADRSVRVCPDCRTQELVLGLLAKTHIKPIFQGDPRGAVLLLSTPTHPRTEDGRGRGLCVPVRR